MKTIQQKRSELNGLISTSEIYTAIELLQTRLDTYERSLIARNYNYVIHVEFIEVNREISNLKNQLQSLISESRVWEGIE